jgi:hypothetical protein
VRESAGRTARRRIEEEYQWQRVAEGIEKAYFKVMGWELAGTPVKRPNARVREVGDRGDAERRAG